MQVAEKCHVDVAQVYPGEARGEVFGTSCREEGTAAAGPAEAPVQVLIPEPCWVIGVGPAALWKGTTFTLP